VAKWAWEDYGFEETSETNLMDLDGWIYTNDVWDDASPYPYSGSVTRRRRWVRRVWFNPKEAGDDEGK